MNVFNPFEWYQGLVKNRACKDGERLRATHEIAGEEILEGRDLKTRAVVWAGKDYQEHIFQMERQDPDYILHFMLGYSRSGLVIKYPSEVKESYFDPISLPEDKTPSVE